MTRHGFDGGCGMCGRPFRVPVAVIEVVGATFRTGRTSGFGRTAIACVLCMLL